MMRSKTLIFQAVRLGLVGLFAALATLAVFASARDGSVRDGGSRDDASGPVMPAYDQDQRLLLPGDYRQWIFVGSSLGMGYSESRGGMEMFHHTLMEPTAYQHFTRTGEFREGTQFVLLLQGLGEGVLPQRTGHFADKIHGVEMAVKDSRTFADGWAYFGFGGMGAIRDRAKAFDSSSCNSCHSQHAAQDNVFVQFYPLLREAAPTSGQSR